MFSAKKIAIIAAIVILLVAIPLTLYLLQQQQEVRSNAQQSSTLSFSPPSTTSSPIQAKINDPVDLDLFVDPGQNLVSFVRLEIQYDSTKLAASASGETEVFEKNDQAFPSTREGPVYTDGKIQVTLSIGSDLTKPIKTRTKIGTVHFTAIAKTDTPTQVLYSASQTQVLSIAGPGTGSADQASENVLLSSSPAVIDIVAPTDEITPTPTVVDEPSPTVTPGLTITPTLGANQAPVCSIFTATPSAGTAPLDVVFHIEGTDNDGSVTKIAFNYGDGNIATLLGDQLVSTASGKAATSVQHTYMSGGTFTASAVLTDNLDMTSTATTDNPCSQVITVAGPTATPTAALTEVPTLGVDTPTPTLASPGPGATIIGLGAFFSVLSLIGAVLFFAL